jgi:hypothetical protein
VVTNRTVEEIVECLHENNYDVASTTDFLFEKGELQSDWKTVGATRKKQTLSPDQTLDEEGEFIGASGKNKTGKKPATGKTTKMNKQQQQQNQKSRGDDEHKAASSGRKQWRTEKHDAPPQMRTSRRPNRIDSSRGGQMNQTEEKNIEERMASLDTRDQHNEQQLNGSSAYHSNEFDEQQQQQQSFQYGRAKRPNGAPLPQRGVNRYRGIGNRPARGQFAPVNKSAASREAANLDEEESGSGSGSGGGGGVNADSELNTINRTVDAVISTNVIDSNEILPGTDEHKKYKNDNLRDIGTWSNDQANSGAGHHQKGSSSSGRIGTRGYNNAAVGPGAAAATTKSAHSTGSVTQSKNVWKNRKNSTEEWDNDEEWQGDLTKTQIFTASNQKKDANAANEIRLAIGNDSIQYFYFYFFE